MYANRAIAEPTRAGKWWRKAAPDACSIIVTVYCGEDYMRWDYPSGGSRRVYREEGVTWTGPIPVPEDKPAVSDEELGRNIGQFLACHYKILFTFTSAEWAEFGATIRAELIST